MNLNGRNHAKEIINNIRRQFRLFLFSLSGGLGASSISFQLDLRLIEGKVNIYEFDVLPHGKSSLPNNCTKMVFVHFGPLIFNLQSNYCKKFPLLNN